MGLINSRIREDDLLTELEHLNATYLNLYKTYEYVKAQEHMLLSENNYLKKQINSVIDRTNIDNFLSDHDNSILEDTFEKAYITKYHSYLETLIPDHIHR